MALFNFVCPECGTKKRRICSPDEAEKPINCQKCTAVLVRAPTGPTKQVMERLDSTHMPRAVERLSEAERLYRERAEKHKKDG